MAGVVNIDGIGFLGKTRDVNVIGQGKSSLDQVIESIAKWQGRVVVPDLHPDRGYYYRSDQFSLAKLGVPAIYLHAGQEVEGKPEGWGREQIEQWVEKHYHQPSDEFRADWDLSGAVQDAKLLFLATMAIAEADNIPTWKPGDEFEAARKQAIEALPP
jgi:Zn-dependent M28 family amino/carboxypeptidase